MPRKKKSPAADVAIMDAPLETKAAPGPETKSDDQVSRMERLLERAEALEVKTVGSDTDLDTLEAKLDRLERQGQRPPEAGKERMDAGEWKADDGFDLEFKEALEAYLRRGDEIGLRDLEAKEMTTLHSEEGGYFVNSEFSNEIEEILFDRSPIRRIARVMEIGAKSVEIPAATSDIDAGWVGELDARPATKTPKIDKIEIMAHEMYARPGVSQAILEDAAIDVEDFLADRIADYFERFEAESFIQGDGVGKPRGFLTYPQVADASWTWGKVGYVKSGDASGFPDTNPGDQLDPLINVQTALRSEYHRNASWVMNRSTGAFFRKLKDADGRFIWTDSLTDGEPDRLLGRPVIFADHMPDIAAGKTPIAFGDFSRAYLIVDRLGTTIRRLDHNPPMVEFYARRRVGGDVVNSQAIKLIKIAN